MWHVCVAQVASGSTSRVCWPAAAWDSDIGNHLTTPESIAWDHTIEASSRVSQKQINTSAHHFVSHTGDVSMIAKGRTSALMCPQPASETGRMCAGLIFGPCSVCHCLQVFSKRGHVVMCVSVCAWEQNKHRPTEHAVVLASRLFCICTCHLAWGSPSPQVTANLQNPCISCLSCPPPTHPSGLQIPEIESSNRAHKFHYE